MLIRYQYARLDPPAPLILVGIRCPFRGVSVADVPALLDTGADRSVLTRAVVDALGLAPAGVSQFQGFGSQVIELPLFLIDLHIHEFTPNRIRPTLGEGEPFLILGRDVLNTFKVVLDGPNLVLELSRPGV